MTPLLRSDDTLYFKQDKIRYCIGDVYLFKDPEDKELIAHRLISKQPYIFKGDLDLHWQEVSKQYHLGKLSYIKRQGTLYQLKKRPQLLLNFILSLTKLTSEKYSRFIRRPMRTILKLAVLVEWSLYARPIENHIERP
jgi:hypothetical protein